MQLDNFSALFKPLLGIKWQFLPAKLMFLITLLPQITTNINNICISTSNQCLKCPREIVTVDLNPSFLFSEYIWPIWTLDTARWCFAYLH